MTLMVQAATRGLRRTLLPMTAYYAITLVVPIAHGAWRSRTGFIVHALLVLVVPPIIVVLSCAVAACARAVASRFNRT